MNCGYPITTIHILISDTRWSKYHWRGNFEHRHDTQWYADMIDCGPGMVAAYNVALQFTNKPHRLASESAVNPGTKTIKPFILY